MDCRDKCVNRGKAYGLSQESYCSHCIRGDARKKDLYDEGSRQHNLPLGALASTLGQSALIDLL